MSRTLGDIELRPNERAALEELASRLREQFGERLVKLVFYGSRARGEGGEESDLDVMVVIHGYDRLAEDNDAVHSIAFDIDLRCGVFTQTVEYSESEYRRRVQNESPFVMNVERDGVPLCRPTTGDGIARR